MLQKYILLFSALITFVTSAAISAIPIGIYNQAEVSGLFPTLFTPDTFTFSIWGFIYACFLALGIYEALGKSWIKKKNVMLLAAAQIISSLWLIPSQYLYIGSSLGLISLILYILTTLLFQSRDEHRYFKYTLELFFGWILVAFIANIHLFLVSYEVYYFPEVLTYISIFIALFINMYLIVRYHIFIPSFVLIWASIGIISGQENLITQLFTSGSILLLIASYIWSYKQRKK